MARIDGWQALCKQVESDDGLMARDCGPWTEQKLWFWHRYLSITTNAMVGPKWKQGLVYIDLFGGPGVCKIETTGRRLPGSPLIAANTPKPFSKILLCELGEDEASACKRRMEASPASDRFEIIEGDCNSKIEEVVSHIPQGALSLAFVDPEGLDFHFETLRRLTQGRAVDLLMLFADAIDAVRNAERMLGEDESRLDLLFGPDANWRDEWSSIRSLSGPLKRDRLRSILCKQLETRLGYAGTRSVPICGPHGPLYSLIYASKHRRGLDFWDKSVAKELGGQSTLF